MTTDSQHVRLQGLSATNFSISLAALIRSNASASSSQIVSLDLSLNPSLGDRCILQLESLVKASACSLLHLNLERTGITGLSGARILRWLPRTCGLRSLNLGSNVLGSAFFNKFVDAMTVEGKLRSLRQLGLSNVGMDDCAAVKLFSALIQNSHVERVSVSMNNLRYRTGATLVTFLGAMQGRHTLLYIDLSYTAVSESLVSSVDKLLLANSKLIPFHTEPRVQCKPGSDHGKETPLGKERVTMQPGVVTVPGNVSRPRSASVAKVGKKQNANYGRARIEAVEFSPASDSYSSVAVSEAGCEKPEGATSGSVSKEYDRASAEFVRSPAVDPAARLSQIKSLLKYHHIFAHELRASNGVIRSWNRGHAADSRNVSQVRTQNSRSSCAHEFAICQSLPGKYAAKDRVAGQVRELVSLYRRLDAVYM